MKRLSGETHGDSAAPAAPADGAAGAPAELYNPPGRRSLSFRAGTYASFLEGMLARMQQQALRSGPSKGRSPLALLNVGGESNVALALLKAWAVVGDVLTFYQERIINEGYIRTATEPRSWLALVRTVGYKPDPGLAATTYLAFTVRDTKTSPARVSIPAGTGVMSTPKQPPPGAQQTSAQQPQTFETAEGIVARAEWNALTPYVPTATVAQEIYTGTTLVYLAGVTTRLKPGATVLLVGDAGSPPAAQFLLRTVASAETDAKNGYTVVTLQPASDADAVGERLANPEFYAFRQQARLFGYNATQWADAPANIRQQYGTPKGGAFLSTDGGATWRPRNASVPQGDVRALVANEGVVLAGVAGGGVYRLPEGGAAWEPASAGLTRSDVHCLAANALGHVYAGTSGGGVFRSTDNGSTWVALGGGTVTLKKDKDGNLLPTTTRLPNTVVRALAAYTDADTGVTHIYAGTDNGVYAAKDDLSGWESLHRSLDGIVNARNELLASTVVNTLTLRRSLDRTLVYAGTDNSVYLWHPLTGWSADNKNLPGAEHASDRTTAKVYALHAYEDSGEDFRLLAATSAGVYRYRSEWSGWELASNGLPAAGSPPDSPPAAVTSLASSTDPATGATVVFAGTDAGLYYSRDDGANWSHAEAALYQPLFSIASQPYQPELDAAIISDDLARQFRDESVALSADSFVTVEAGGGRWLITDSAAQRVYALVFDGAASIDVYLTNSVVSAVAAGAGGLVAAAAPLDGYVEREWPGFVVNPRRFDLDTIHNTILDGSYVALSQSAPPSDAASPPDSPPAAPVPSEVHRVVTSTTAPVNEFGRSATTTTVETDAPDAPAEFDRRATNLFLQSERLSLYEAQLPQPQPVLGSAVELAGLVQGIRQDQPLAFTGRQASAVIVADLGGVFGYDGQNWTPAGLQNNEITALVLDPQGRLFAGTRGRGLLLLGGDGLATQLNVGASPNAGSTANVCALACDYSRGALLAGFEGGGFYVSADAGVTWSRVALPASNDVSAFAFDGGAWLCATDGGGVFRSDDAGQSWTPAQTGPAATDITSLAVVAQSGAARSADQSTASRPAGQPGSSIVFAGTKGGGVFRSADGGATWLASNAGLANTDVCALAADAAGRLFAGTRGGGVFVSDDRGAAWRAANNDLANRDVRSLACAAVAGAHQLFAGTRGGGVFVSADGGARWAAAPTGVSNDVRALAADASGRVFAGARNVAVLTPAHGARSVETRSDPVFTADEQYRADLDLAIIPDPLAKLFAAAGAPLAKGASVAVEQPGALWLVLDGAGTTYVVKNEAGALVVYRPSYALRVASAPTTPDAQGAQKSQGPGAQTWSLVTDANFAGRITALGGEISFGPAASDAPVVSEVGFAKGVTSEPNEDFSTVALGAPLANVFDADTLAVCANVAYATHGETVPLEILGSGDASRISQSFALKKPPLTYVPSPSSPDLAESTLAVSISNVVEDGGVQMRAGNLTTRSARSAGISVRWGEVPTLYDAGPQDRVYEVRADAQGNSTVVFGDGVHGARLPSGAENVVATYRSGIGTAGNLDANQLTMLKSKPAGVRSVTNPAPAEGGVNPEPMRTARTKAPLTVRTLGRIVSLLDYEDFVSTQPGVGKARVQIVYGGRARVVYLTVAMEDGTPLATDSGYYRDLVQAISEFQASAQPVQIGGYEPLLFNVRAHVLFDPRGEAAQIEQLARAALADAFSFERRGFGEGVESSEVIAIIQDTAGVVAVYLEAFHVVGSSPAVEPRLDADLARWDERLKQIRPAQLLLINPPGVKLEMEPAP